jgi:hypothetical protein
MQRCGYFEFVLQAEKGAIIDLHLVEDITPRGVVQHTADNRNGMRYISKGGRQRFTSLKRRAGRYLFVTLRDQRTPIRLESLRLIESTAPVKPIAAFRCSDSILTRVWDISERTLRLCMEDTFTDCPLYEQTLWIGDARNEALYAYSAYGNTDVSRRSIELGAQSLEHFPMVGCQVPSAWDCTLPAWSFLWGMMVWEYYFQTRDRAFLRRMWPAVRQNARNALKMTDRRGLFSARLWNLLEWADIDHDHATVLHNSMLLVAALRAAEKCACVLEASGDAKRLEAARAKLIRAINRRWDRQRAAYPDSIHANGKVSPKICQHTGMLAVMCGILPEKYRDIVRGYLLKPPPGMTTVGSPFAMQFMFEALEALGEYDAVMDAIRNRYGPMLDAGATTVWEMFPGSHFDTGGFATRSHCHAWSCSPLYFLHRITLGIRAIAPGGRAYEISPWVRGLTHASGATGGEDGPVHCAWRRQGTLLIIQVQAPAGAKVRYVRNASHEGLTVRFSAS